mmetsp:Transcript_36546/g.76702  ORF Transcript_36546/g.76702 Transcript_36546/m.76702 type:complete len:170 (+) Transcript_36546:111-620(+)
MAYHSGDERTSLSSYSTEETLISYRQKDNILKYPLFTLEPENSISFYRPLIFHTSMIDVKVNCLVALSVFSKSIFMTQEGWKKLRTTHDMSSTRLGFLLLFFSRSDHRRAEHTINHRPRLLVRLIPTVSKSLFQSIEKRCADSIVHGRSYLVIFGVSTAEILDLGNQFI